MLLSFIFCYAITTLAMPFFIKYMHKKQFGQAIREEGPAWHQAKSGTPAMGGLVFLGASVLTILMMSIVQQHWSNSAWALVIALLFFGGIGFADDFLKIFKKQNEGLSSKQKFVLQLLGSALMSFIFVLFGLEVELPIFNLASLSHPILIFLFLLFWITGFSNAFNLTDGLDGLSSGCGIISFMAYLVMALQAGEQGIALFCVTMIAALLGFILFNVKPAKIFMGDVGSLALGAVLAVLSLLIGNPWTLLFAGIIYVAETASVILQVASFKLTGKRIFKMSPIHHHFEMLGWSEWKVDLVFWAVQLIGALIAIAIF
ncbi:MULTISPECIES: phospho-N-acetylmuramoyl-pentapeptide-transferase [Aerococcus]|uniref:Phospho-N-acetylmuramoyl-pentapeptide-transferase n=1 Tax=Aerococcus sanguinicola TaxID=119206 RepID=A0A5N1GKX5_9LACT|nr:MULTISPECIES: phospho-N-acetylmuramoyl-pentapeptide-transferase [Aerococcus]KAA9300869.1 phospho-N-acetylmuramoyl-pentapeptide-transferase [Aerococcus sanguinicola]MDK6369100.1 phospho-N-acetylmuramoyl-pentapeptide-transferase [Aerococcus sp. UMB9870]MDK6679841.1 phospho-N-acetylmuramoyl-pentapeptide-transferase [Aerococcus sp. UMB8608]MDK6686593.1 phospho-N-acetylmuramoyl-pentapeptide-transferase [Aerococcus sp. UMB8623]MDK6939763.1 phospho-N-acetylmuramoyl-pentapeptide-transferase [Aeroco